jgi:hypothetical protein
MDAGDLDLQLGVAHGSGRDGSAAGLVVGDGAIGNRWQIGSTP